MKKVKSGLFVTKPRRNSKDLPEYVSQNPVMKRDKPLSKKGLAAFSEALLLLFTPTNLPAFYIALRKKVIDGDMEAIKLMASIYNLTPSKGGISITNNVIQGNIQAANANDRTFDNIVRMIASEKEAAQVIDVTPERR